MEEGCSCHINPPCGYCTSRSECERCGTILFSDDMFECMRCGELVCDDCFRETLNVCDKCFNIITREENV